MTQAVSFWDGLAACAQQAAHTAAEGIRTAFHSTVAAEYKHDATPVTQADRAAEQCIRAVIQEQFPDHGIIGEEFPAVASNSPYTWVIDPIDGTKSFITGRPLFCILIAVLEDGQPKLGLMYQPIQDQLWLAHPGLERTLFNGQPVPLLTCTDLNQAVIATTGPDYFDASELKTFLALSEQCQFAQYGGDCYNYGLLARNRLDLVVESGLSLHDYAALVPLIENAGGVISDWRGQPLSYSITEKQRVLAAATPALHQQALAFL